MTISPPVISRTRKVIVVSQCVMRTVAVWRFTAVGAGAVILATARPVIGTVVFMIFEPQRSLVDEILHRDNPLCLNFLENGGIQVRLVYLHQKYRQVPALQLQLSLLFLGLPAERFHSCGDTRPSARSDCRRAPLRTPYGPGARPFLARTAAACFQASALPRPCDPEQMIPL